MNKINETIIRSVSERSFVTAIFGIFSRNDGKFRYCNAGHPPALVLHQDSSNVFLQFGDLPLGAFSKYRYLQPEILLDASDVVTFYTDGIIEARRDSELYGDGRLADTLTSFRDIPVREFPLELLKDVTDFSRGELRDDIAVLTIRFA